MSWSLVFQMAKEALLNLEISFLAITIGLIGGTLLRSCNSQKLKIPFLAQLINAYITVIRGTPLFVQSFDGQTETLSPTLKTYIFGGQK